MQLAVELTNMHAALEAAALAAAGGKKGKVHSWEKPKKRPEGFDGKAMNALTLIVLAVPTQPSVFSLCVLSTVS